MPTVIVIAHNIRSAHNVGAIFRTCDGFGVSQLILSGYTPYPTIPNDQRLPHIRDKLTAQIHKTALGAETTVPFRYCETPPLAELARDSFSIVALEQNAHSVQLPVLTPPERTALLLGEEVAGITDELLEKCDTIVEIPMHGTKESFNVSVATGIALYQICAARSI